MFPEPHRLPIRHLLCWGSAERRASSWSEVITNSPLPWDISSRNTCRGESSMLSFVRPRVPSSLESVANTSWKGHCRPYRAFVETLKLVAGRAPARVCVSQQCDEEPVASRFFANPAFVAWEDGSGPKALRLVLEQDIDFAEYFDSVASRITAGDEPPERILLRLGYWEGCTTPQQACASLCLQFLEQRPSLILWTRHLFSLRLDADLCIACFTLLPLLPATWMSSTNSPTLWRNRKFRFDSWSPHPQLPRETSPRYAASLILTSLPELVVVQQQSNLEAKSPARTRWISPPVGARPPVHPSRLSPNASTLTSPGCCIFFFKVSLFSMFNNMDVYPLSIKATIDESQLRNAPYAGRTQSCRRLRHRRESYRALRFYVYRNLKLSDNRSHRDGDDGRIKLWRRLQKQRATVLKHFYGSCLTIYQLQNYNR
jgi:hypothetical protein